MCYNYPIFAHNWSRVRVGTHQSPTENGIIGRAILGMGFGGKTVV